MVVWGDPSRRRYAPPQDEAECLPQDEGAYGPLRRRGFVWPDLFMLETVLRR